METNNKDLEISNLFDVKGKVALVTGGGRSILQSLLLRCSTDSNQALELGSWLRKPLQLMVPRST